MQMRRLQVFSAVAKYGSFTRAAESVFMTQPAVTFQIKQLEEYFNMRLLDRGHGKIKLTVAGELMLAYAERILGVADELEARMNELSGDLSGALRIGTSTTIAAYWLPQLLQEFCTRYPGVVPYVVVGNSQLIESRVAERELDVGLIEIASEQNTLSCVRAAQDELFAIFAPEHELAASTALEAAQLAEHPFITRDSGNAIRILAEQFFQAAQIDPATLKVRAELGSLMAVKQLVMGGMGFGIATGASVRRELENGDLRAVSLSPQLYTPLELIVPKDKFRSQLISVFADYVPEALQKVAAQHKG